MPPFFSIVIPVYNVAPYLRECLDSVLGQTFLEWEAICINDGSTDDSGKILDEYADKDNRIRVVHQQNSGVSSVRNLGISLGTGLWIGFLDGDDYVTSDWLRTTKMHIEKFKPEIVRGWFCYIRFRGMFLQHGDWENDIEIIEGRRHILNWAWCTYLNEGWIWLNFYKKAYLSRIGVAFNPEVRVKEDVLFCLDAAIKATRIVQHREPEYRYRMRMESLWHGKRCLRDRTVFLRQLLDKWGGARLVLSNEHEYLKVLKELRLALENEIKEIISLGSQIGDGDNKDFRRIMYCFENEGVLKIRRLPLLYRICLNDYIRDGQISRYALICRFYNVVLKYIVKICSRLNI